MSNLSPEERAKIYEEEKTKIEAQAELRNQNLKPVAGAFTILNGFYILFNFGFLGLIWLIAIGMASPFAYLMAAVFSLIPLALIQISMKMP